MSTIIDLTKDDDVERTDVTTAAGSKFKRAVAVDDGVRIFGYADGVSVITPRAEVDTFPKWDMLSFVVPGKPVAQKQRGFVRGKNGKGHFFNPSSKEQRGVRKALEEALALLPKESKFTPWPKGFKLKVKCEFYHELPAGATGKIGDPCEGRADTDNMLKFVNDVGNKLLFHDDKQITAQCGKKLYGERNETRVTLQPANKKERRG